MTQSRWIRRLMFTLLVVAVAAPAIAAPPPEFVDPGGPGFWHINPKQTFYRTSNDPKAETPIFFILAELPGSINQKLQIHIYGDYATTKTSGDIRKELRGCFTKTPTVLGPTVVKRLPDAIDARCHIVSPPTYHLNLPTDIPEDFRITFDAQGNFLIAIPPGAEWIVLCVPDNFYGDNSDPDDDLWLRFSRR